MKVLFSLFLNASFWGSILIVVSLVLRPFLRKAPRRILCVLWILVILRLLIPFELESRLSLQPDFVPSQSVTEQIAQLPSVPSVQIPAPDTTPVIPDVTPAPDVPQTETPAPKMEPLTVIGMVWFCVACVALCYNFISYFGLLYKVRQSVPGADGIRQSDQIPGAFLLGYCRPKIYLPIGLSEQDRQFIIAHEKAHIRRGDNWWKLLGIICLCIHWYNPLVGLFYLLMCRDIEVACDERVVRDMPLEERKAYSMALLNCGKRMSGFFVASAAFGEISLKQRIKKVLSYRNPARWITVIGILLVVVALVGFMTNPVQSPQNPTAQTPTDSTQATENTPKPTDTQMPAQTVTSGSCNHNWKAATCIAPMTCATCGEITGTLRDHSWNPATCSTPPTCAICGITTGTPTADHKMQGEKCTVCGIGVSKGLGILSDGTQAYVIGIGTCTDAHIVIPSTYEGVPVTQIDSSAFIYNKQIISVTVPDSVKKIQDGAFMHCSNMTHIRLPQQMDYWGGAVFGGCSSLQSIQIPAGVRCDNAFSNCTSLQSIHIPLGVKAIGSYSLQYCTSLTTITFGGTVAQWKDPESPTSLFYKHNTVPATVVVCTNGTVPISAS